MKALQSRGWRIAFLLVSSGCAGSLDNAEDYQTVPVQDAGPARPPQAGRAPASAGQGGWAGSKPAASSAGSGGWSAPPASAGMRAPTGGAGQSSPDPREEDAGIAEAGSGATQPPPMAAACDFRALMQAKCGNATCHGGPGASTGLDLTSAMLGARVADREGKGACSDKLLVDPENPRDSKLYLKVSGSSCGSQMPLGGQLNADEQACVLTWIEGL